MASISAAATTSTFVRPAVPRPAGISASPVLGLPQFRVKNGNVRCSASKNDKTSTGVTYGAAASLLAAASMSAGPALALVDERMSTEGTGLSLGISNNLLGWIILGVFGLIWSLYIVYTSGLDEDEESEGLSL